MNNVVTLKLSLIISLLISSCFSGRPTLYTPGVVSQEYLSTVRLMVMCPSGGKIGTGVAIDKRHVITAKHVATCANEDGQPETTPLMIMAVTAKRDRQIMLVDKLSSTVDAARLVVAGTDEPFFYYARVDTRNEHLVGEPVCTVGGDGAVFLMRKCGELIPPVDDVYLAASIAGVPGNSGSGVWTISGELIAILSRASWGLENEKLILAVPVESFKEELLADIYQLDMDSTDANIKIP